MNKLPPCYRCRKQPCECADGITLYYADCRDVLPLLEPVDLVLTDPPYGIGANKMTLGNAKTPVYRGERDWDAAPVDLGLLLEIGVCTIVWGGNFYQLPISRCWLVWDKGTGANDYADCELAWTNRDGVVKKFSRGWVGNNARERNENVRWHPTQKPVALMRWCVEMAGGDGTVFDPFAGSGTTGVACKQLGRKCIMVEIEEKYCDVIVKRLRKPTLGLYAQQSKPKEKSTGLGL